jgi:hypothetical protein
VKDVHRAVERLPGYIGSAEIEGDPADPDPPDLIAGYRGTEAHLEDTVEQLKRLPGVRPGSLHPHRRHGPPA